MTWDIILGSRSLHQSVKKQSLITDAHHENNGTVLDSADNIFKIKFKKQKGILRIVK